MSECVLQCDDLDVRRRGTHGLEREVLRHHVDPVALEANVRTQRQEQRIPLSVLEIDMGAPCSRNCGSVRTRLVSAPEWVVTSPLSPLVRMGISCWGARCSTVGTGASTNADRSTSLCFLKIQEVPKHEYRNGEQDDA